MKLLKWILYIILSILVLWIIAGCVVVFYIVPRTDLKQIAEETIDDYIEAKSSMSSLDFTFLSSFPYFALDIDDFAIYGKESGDTIIYVENTSCTISITELFHNRIAVKDITLSKPYVNFIVDSTGSNNFNNILNKNAQQSDSVTAGIFNLNNMSINDGRLGYSNATTGKSINLGNLNFQFQGRINMKDSVLDVRQGKFFINDNHLDFEGHVDTEYIDFFISHNLKNLNTIRDIAVSLFNVDELADSYFKGETDGECHIEGELNDSLQGITISGRMGAKEINGESSKRKNIITGGDFELAYRLITGNEDSTSLILDHLNLSGKHISMHMGGSFSNKKHKPFVDAKVKAEIDMTNFIRMTSLLPKKHSLQGNLKADISVSSSVDDLQNKYSFPKDLKELFDLNIAIDIPNVSGKMNFQNIKYNNDTIRIEAERLNMNMNGKRSYLATDFRNLKFRHNGKLENASIIVGNADIDVDGKNLLANAKIKGTYITDVINNTDSVFVSAGNLDMKLACIGKNVADVTIDAFAIRHEEESLKSDRINGRLLKLTKKPDKIWDACSIEAKSVRGTDGKMDYFCREMDCSFNYGNTITDYKANADSVDFQTEGHRFLIKNSSVSSLNEDELRILAKSAETGNSIFGMDAAIHNIDVIYNTETHFAKLNAERVRAGNTDISINGTVDIDKESPVVNINIKGRYLDLNEIMTASNKIALASHDPNAVPLDSIPEGQIPVTVGPDGQNITLALDVKRMTLTSLMLSNVKGKIYMRGKKTLIDDLNATDSGYKLKMSTMISYVNRRLSINDIILKFNDLDVSKLSEIIPSFSNAAPILSSLKGNLNLDVVVSTPVRQILAINLMECKAAVAIQARDLAITDNEIVHSIGKELMFKDKEHTRLDSVAIAAEIENGQVKLHPVIVKIDRYKIAMTGSNDMITKKVDYHISVLKSPIPFKFGININKGSSKQKVKIVRTELKKLDPNIKPWTDPGFIQLSNTLRQPIELFRSSLQ